MTKRPTKDSSSCRGAVGSLMVNCNQIKRSLRLAIGNGSNCQRRRDTKAVKSGTSLADY